LRTDVNAPTFSNKLRKSTLVAALKASEENKHFAVVDGHFCPLGSGSDPDPQHWKNLERKHTSD
jgi:NADPH-dependent glutamate synthase beta subunit-like oxidoreductase